jgi:hypothetical protein
MSHYPIDLTGSGAKANSVMCRTPKWDIGDKPSEVATLDIAVNGHDFKGNFAFTFTINLLIHRTVPMAGRTQGKTKTRCMGLGFKPVKSKVDLKFGVLTVTVIDKEMVTEYIY